MAADGWRYGQGQGLHGSLVRSILEPTIRGEPFPLWKQLAVNPPYAREASRVAAIVLGYRDGHWNVSRPIATSPALWFGGIFGGTIGFALQTNQ